MSDINSIQGIEQAKRSLQNLGSPDRIFFRKSLRRSIRAGSKVILAAMYRVVPVLSSLTQGSLSLNAIKKRKHQIADTIGSYSRMFGSVKFYTGWANFGHRIYSKKTAGSYKQLEWEGTDAKGRRRVRRGAKSAGFVMGKLWTEPVEANFDYAQSAVVDTLKAEIEGREWAK